MEQKKIETLKVFIASPMDIKDERDQLKAVLEEINSSEGASEGYRFELICWENDTRPGFGVDAQHVVNSQLPEYDICVCLFKNKLGTPTNRAASGTVEEYERARIKRVYKEKLIIMSYFFETEKPVPEVVEMKDKVARDGALYWTVSKETDFSSLTRKHFSDVAKSWLKKVSEENEKAEKHALQRASYVGIVCGNEILMLQRSLKSRLGRGQWQLPGGKADVKDGAAETHETPEDTAVRELKEELGYDVAASDLTKINVISTCLDNDPNRPFEITLFIHKVAEKFEPTICEESEAYEWMQLSRCDLCKKLFFKHTKSMINSVWREINLTSTLRKLSAYLSELEVDASEEVFPELPAELPGVSYAELHSAYVTLSLLGVIHIGSRGFELRSKYSPKILEEIVSILSGGDAIFRNDRNVFRTKRKLSETARDQLKEFKNKAFCSNDALVSFLSLDTKMKNETRRVCDLLLFGSHDEKYYVLMRWDFLANKYQFISKGLEQSTDTSMRDNVDYVLDRRFPNMKKYLDFELIARYVAGHFSAGSMAIDPIWRDNVIEFALLMPQSTSYGADIQRIIEDVNRHTEQILEQSEFIDRDVAKTLNYFVWCELDELLKDAGKYRGRRVAGMGDLIDDVKCDNLRALADNPLTHMELIDNYPTDDSVNNNHRLFINKFQDIHDKK